MLQATPVKSVQRSIYNNFKVMAKLSVATLVILSNVVEAKSTDKGDQSKLELSGKIMLDSYQVDDLFLDDDYADFAIRRADIGADYRFNSNWQAEVKIAYDQQEESLEIKDLAVTNTQLDFAKITVGRFKEPMGFEYQSSSANIAPMERSMVTNAFVPKRNSGVMLSASHKKVTWAVGWFNNAEDIDFTESAFTGRATYATSMTSPIAWVEKFKFHVGGSFSSRTHSSEDAFRINQPFEIYGSNSVIESTKIDATSETLLGLEFGVFAGPVSFHGEYFSQNITADRDSNDIDSDYSGYYTQLTYNVTGESVKVKKGKISGIKPTSDLGALTFVVRYSELNARDHLDGSEATSVYYGLNYHYNKKLRAQLGYLVADLYGKNSIFLNHGKAVSMRLQYGF